MRRVRRAAFTDLRARPAARPHGRQEGRQARTVRPAPSSERAIGHACRKRDVDPAKIDRLVSGVQRQMETQGDEVTSVKIGEAVMLGLKTVDHVAYIALPASTRTSPTPRLR
jgi:hypothetical protein